MKFFKKIITFLFNKYVIEKHKFLPSTLIYRDGTKTLFEVDSNYYNKQFEPITIVRAYPMGEQLLGISKHEIIEFHEYKNMPKEGFATTSHENHKFANYRNKK